ncbi:MAG: DUF2254 domain-containing protein, partial [Burkholderiales bacterium]
MRLWLIPLIYVVASITGGLVLPRVEHEYLAAYTVQMSVTSAQALLSAGASGMMALAAIVFSIAFIMVQFSAIAYSPRLVIWVTRDRALFHSLGVFTATFMYSLFTLAWIDREGAGTVPFFSVLLVCALIIFSMILFARLVQSLAALQITNVLHMIGDKGREVIDAMFAPLNSGPGTAGNLARAADHAVIGPAHQVLKYAGAPRAIATLDTRALVRQAQQVGGVIVMACAVGDTVVNDTVLLQVHGTKDRLPEKRLLRSVHFAKERSIEQDPKYPIRLLVDVAIKALSPAINDPTTAVQTIDQIEDLLRRLGQCELDAGYASDANGHLRLVFPMPTWEDYLQLAFDEIRQYGATSVQVMRRLRSALIGILESLTNEARLDAVRRCIQ